MVDLREELYRLPGGDKFRLCIQCGTCAASCPNTPRMDYTPRQVVAMVGAGMIEEVLRSNAIWMCASCFLCTVRCPREIQPTELMHALGLLAARHGLITSRTGTPAMYRAFVDSVKSYGRVHEFGFMFNFLRSRPREALRMLPVGLTLLRLGRVGLRPPRRGAGARDLALMLNRIQDSNLPLLPEGGGGGKV